VGGSLSPFLHQLFLPPINLHIRVPIILTEGVIADRVILGLIVIGKKGDGFISITTRSDQYFLSLHYTACHSHFIPFKR